LHLLRERSHASGAEFGKSRPKERKRRRRRTAAVEEKRQEADRASKWAVIEIRADWQEWQEGTGIC